MMYYWKSQFLNLHQVFAFKITKKGSICALFVTSFNGGGNWVGLMDKICNWKCPLLRDLSLELCNS